MSVSRWYDPNIHRGEFYRLVAIAASALQRKGVPAAELSQHVIALNVDNIVTVITRPDAFTDGQWQAARDRLLAQGFKIMLGPDVAFDAVTSTLMSGKADAAFFASLPENIAPSTDDNPFFFLYGALRRLSPASPSKATLEEQRGDQHDPAADRGRARGLLVSTSSCRSSVSRGGYRYRR